MNTERPIVAANPPIFPPVCCVAARGASSLSFVVRRVVPTGVPSNSNYVYCGFRVARARKS